MNKIKTAAALGLFDGVHLGHRAVLRLAVDSGLVPSVFTFEPETVCRAKGQSGFIYTAEEKESLLRQCGIREIYPVSFGEVCGLSGIDFVKNILVDRMNAGFICCGGSFRFGKGASCGAEELKDFGRKYGIPVEIAGDVVRNGETVSSTAIRKALQAGDIPAAEELLGQHYAIEKEVCRGAHVGRTIGFPTINQVYAEGQLVPKFGVYASQVSLDGESFPAVTNVGMKPTVNYSGAPLAETHIIGFRGDIYGKTVKIELLGFIRAEMKFSALGDLKAQISRDIESARHIFHKIS
ncbi:MAG: riboflavin biosynthesis protein RibF [Ruminococcus sp.]|nr:riboflavin biosynthesis protein RibF [Ruminococcus sp.]